ncbi:MAG: hypothetical protein J5830_02030 [Clostridia bacterium]|nr:hypothetical protein [Clostridia bacterium]
MSENRELFEKKPVLSAVMKLALPSVAGQIVLVIYNMADTFFVGMTDSDSMLAAVTVSMPAFLLLSAISNFFGIGAAGVMSRAMGRGDDARAKNASRFAFWGCLTVTALYALFTFFAAGFYADLLGAKASEVHGYTKDYLRIAVAFGGIPTAICTMLAHIVRSEGRSVHASAGLMLGGILNIVLDPLFMFVILPKGSEVLGAAVATALSNLAALIYYVTVVLLLRKREKTCISYKFRAEMFEGSIVRSVVKTGLPACVMTLFENVSYAVLENLVAAASVAAQAGLGVAKKINMLAHSTVRGMSQGVLPLIGYNYANGNRKRMKSVVFTTAAISVAFCLVCMGLFLAFGGAVCGLFIKSDGQSLDYAVRFLSILCVGAPFSAFAYTVISFFQATGKGVRSFILAILRKGILDIPLMFLANAMFGETGAVAATPVTDAICCAVAAVMFGLWIKEHGKDKIAVVVSDPAGPQN